MRISGKEEQTKKTDVRRVKEEYSVNRKLFL